ncbi:MAG: glycosyltransferase [Pegethrix bostrychoides GSE-TBD4-15B]|uniref:Glycosyltransferase n=1 Tax=Pegethrix bostrychoides GSE-TBD4-15B TaxID=2839662 RepID=A0A951PH24_9CYAN|nr:glycosyltransferase [Pegethrix bostrychoides GSE-TBD4-15B]
MKILFLDQTGKIAGAELVLFDLARFYGQNCLVGLFEDGPLRQRLIDQGVPVKVLAQQPLQVRKTASLLQGMASLGQLLPLIQRVVQLSRDYDLVYANTLKAIVVASIASLFSRKPLVIHLHDILSDQHFSPANRRLVVSLANQFASQVIAVSEATSKAFIAAGGNPSLVQVVYNGFDPAVYQAEDADRERLRKALVLEDRFVVGHFSRLSPWKGQHVLIDAMAQCPDHVVALLVGDALFGEQDYQVQLRWQVAECGLQDRVHFLGFRDDVPQLMSACDLVTHTSILPEPASRVLVESLLLGKPLVTVQGGGSDELVLHGETGWLIPSSDPQRLAEMIQYCVETPDQMQSVAQQGKRDATDRFNLSNFQQNIQQILQQIY